MLCRILFALSVTLSVEIVSPPIHAQDTNSRIPLNATARAHNEASADPALSTPDQKYLEDAYERGRFEVGAAQLALEHSGIMEVRVLAARIMENRRQIDEALAGLAVEKGMAAFSDRLDGTHREALELLESASDDDDFDLRYCATVVSGHIRDIKDLQDAAAHGADPKLKQLAAHIASNLKEHLSIALAIQRALAAVLNDIPALNA